MAAGETISLPKELEEKAWAVKKVYDSPEWKVLENVLRAHLEALRTRNEQIMPADERNFLLGELYALRYVLELPEKVAQEIAQVKQAAKLTGPQSGQPEE